MFLHSSGFRPPRSLKGHWCLTIRRTKSTASRILQLGSVDGRLVTGMLDCSSMAWQYCTDLDWIWGTARRAHPSLSAATRFDPIGWVSSTSIVRALA
jgi:hypothetical protein